ncbi:MAG: chorismate mutase [Jatrophihabitantaceae bacterium]
MPHSTEPATAAAAADSTATEDASAPADADQLPDADATIEADVVVDPTVVGVMRGQIDALDTAIARLVAERARLSRRIQSARLNAGGPRVELGRERAILGRYRTSLGSEGAVLAEAVLRVCRGAR